MENQDIKKYGIKELIKTFRDYPKFFTLFSKEEIRKILDKNVESIDLNYFSKLNVGIYSFLKQKISLSKKNKDDKPLTLKNIKKNPKIKTTYMHELLHALFATISNKNGEIKFTDSTFQYYQKGDYEVEVGRGMGEGLKEWLLSKAYNKNYNSFNEYGVKIFSKSESYPIETNVMSQLEIIFGEDKILNTCKNGIVELESCFKENIHDRKLIVNYLDDTNTFDNIIAKLEIKIIELEKQIGENFKLNGNIENNLVKEYEAAKKRIINEKSNLKEIVYKQQKVINQVLIKEFYKTNNPDTIKELLSKYSKIRNLAPQFEKSSNETKKYDFKELDEEVYSYINNMFCAKGENTNEKNILMQYLKEEYENNISKIFEYKLKRIEHSDYYIATKNGFVENVISTKNGEFDSVVIHNEELSKNKNVNFAEEFCKQKPEIKIDSDNKIQINERYKKIIKQKNKMSYVFMFDSNISFKDKKGNVKVYGFDEINKVFKEKRLYKDIGIEDEKGIVKTNATEKFLDKIKERITKLIKIKDEINIPKIQMESNLQTQIFRNKYHHDVKKIPILEEKSNETKEMTQQK